MEYLRKVILLARSIAAKVLNEEQIDEAPLKEIFTDEEKNHILSRISDKSSLKAYQQTRSDLNKDRDEQWKKLESLSVKKSKVISLKFVVRFAAAFIGLAILSGYLFYQISGVSDTTVQIPENVITLELEDGTIQIIDPQKENRITNVKGEVIGVQNKDSISYKTASAGEELAYNVLNVPYGKKFLIALSDGTSVHLNAGSSLRYPIKFLKGHKREVFLDGEAYFDVVKDKEHPFLVNTGALNIEVLGTKFNISSYEEDPQVNTVVVSGLVKVYGDVSKNNDLVTPGRMASWDRLTEQTIVSETDLDLHVGWIAGNLVFRRTTFGAMIKKLERFYDVEITSTNEALNETVFSASFDLNIESIDQVLNYVSKNYPFTYTKDQNKININ
ncbi:FecR domain-containing protein [uncultured Kriegella sp.]|uniref:FecR family protein n=1 Tax=uncultured Kriegella sp. TaxID=1798910 RepID=UPI0030DCD52A|tara:strand:+ start:16382 stop:17542 length:1161 start_codon:yes stop_codon:yes gene_type:complete